MTYQNERAPVGRGAGELNLPSDGGTDHTTPGPPAPDAVEIARALGILFEPDNIVELRALFTRGRKRTDAGYFDGYHRDDLSDAAARLNRDGAAVYVTLNAIDPQLIGRYANRIEQGATSTTSDANVIRRRWLLLDFDPVRPKDTSATGGQFEASKALAGECFKVLADEGWPDPVIAESGNGVHGLYPIDLPNNAETTAIVKGALQGIAQRIDTDGVRLDQSVFNAARIVKLYGTVANKGDHTPETPWRVSRIVSTPRREAIVTLDQLRALAPPAPTTGHRPPPRAGTFDLDAFLVRLGIAYTQDAYEGGERYKLAHCPFNTEHGFGEAAVFRVADGALGFDCKHNSCADRRWGDLREMVDGAQGSRREAVQHAIEGAKEPATEPVSYRRVSDIEAKPIRWMWQGRIARGKVTMLAGHPGLGKSQVTASMAAVVTTGGIWPVDRSQCERGSVIILSAEDDPADTIRPRLEAAGADLGRCYIVDAVRERNKDGTPVTRSFNLAVDIERLGGLARQLGDVALIVIDSPPRARATPARPRSCENRCPRDRP